MVKQPIFPSYGKGVLIVATIANATTTVLQQAKQLCLTNIGTQLIYVRCSFPTDTTAASAADYPVLPNSQQIISKTQEQTLVSFIAPGGAGSSLHIQECEGY